MKVNSSIASKICRISDAEKKVVHTKAQNAVVHRMEQRWSEERDSQAGNNRFQDDLLEVFHKNGAKLGPRPLVLTSYPLPWTSTVPSTAGDTRFGAKEAANTGAQEAGVGPPWPVLISHNVIPVPLDQYLA